MTRHFGVAGVGFVFPEFGARVPIKAVDHPVMHPLGWITHAFTSIQSLLRPDVFLLADHGRQKHTVPPDDGARPTQPGNVRLPADVG